VIFLARLERPFLARISHLAGVQDKKFLFLHNPLRDLARPNSTYLVIKSLRNTIKVEGIDNAPVNIHHLLIGITAMTAIKLIITNSSVPKQNHKKMQVAIEC
jgi:hypothetical protein